MKRNQSLLQGHLSFHSAGVDPKETDNLKNEIEFKQKKMFTIKLGLIKPLENAVNISWNWFIVKKDREATRWSNKDRRPTVAKASARLRKDVSSSCLKDAYFRADSKYFLGQKRRLKVNIKAAYLGRKYDQKDTFKSSWRRRIICIRLTKLHTP